MSVKAKLISCIAAFILVLGIMFVSVLAAEQVQVNIGGSVSFTATSVHAMITGSVQNSTTENNLPAKEIDASISDGAVSMDGDWQSMKLNFDENATDIIVTINIQNLSSDRTIYVNLTDNTNISNVNVTRVVGAETLGSGVFTKASTITGGQTLTYTFTLSVASKDFDVTNGSFDLDIDLSSTELITGYTVTITGDGVVEGNDTIYFVVNGTSYSYNYSTWTGTVMYTNVNTLQFGYHGTAGSIREDGAYTINFEGNNIIDSFEDVGESVYSQTHVVTEDMNIEIYRSSFAVGTSYEIWDYEYNGYDNIMFLPLNEPGTTYNGVIYKVLAYMANINAGVSSLQIEFDPEVTQYTYGLVLNGISEEYGAVASVSEIRNIPSDIKILDFSQCYVETVPDISNCNSLTDVYLGADEIIYSTYDSGESTFLENLRTLCEEYISTYGSADDFTLYLDLNNCYYMGEAFEMLDLYGFVEVDERELTEEEYYFNYTEDNYFAIFKYQG